MGLRQQIFADKTEAMKKGEAARLQILRMLASSIQNQEIEDKVELDDEKTQAVIRRQVKQLTDALADFQKAERQDLVQQTQAELAVLTSYLPAELSDLEIEQIFAIILADETAPYNAGKIMGAVMKKVAGRASGNRVKEIVARKLV